MNDSEERTIIAEMLKFYSSKANTHASFIVAEIFGFYTLLFNAKVLPLWVFIFAGVCLILVNLYSLVVFIFYSAIVSSYRYQLLGNMKRHEKEIYGILEKDYVYFKISRRLKKFFTKKIKVNTFTLDLKIIIFPIVWFFIIFLPFFFVLRSLIV